MKNIFYAITIALGLSGVGINAAEADAKAMFTELTGKVDRGGDLFVYDNVSPVQNKLIRLNEIVFKFFNKEFFESLNCGVNHDEVRTMVQNFMQQMPESYLLAYAYSSKLIETSGDKNVYITRSAQKTTSGIDDAGFYKMLNLKDDGAFNIVKYAPQNSMMMLELSIDGAGVYDFVQWYVENTLQGSMMELESSLIGDNNEVDVAALLASINGRLGVYIAPFTGKDGKMLCQFVMMVPDNNGALKKMITDKALSVSPKLESGDLVKLSETRFSVANDENKVDQPYCLTIYTGLDKYVVLGTNLNDEFKVLPVESQIYNNVSTKALFKDMPRNGFQMMYMNLNGPAIDKMLSDSGISEGVTGTIFTENDFAKLPFYLVSAEKDVIYSVGKSYLSPVDYALTFGEILLKKIPLVFNTYLN